MPYQEILSDFENGLTEMQRVTTIFMEEAMLGIQICNDTLSNLRMAVAKDGFKDKEDEIHFFKNIKSRPLGFLVYYSEVRSCEMRMPKWGMQAKLEFIETETDRINSFFENNLDFQWYMENGDAKRDKIYFTREHLPDSPLTISYPYFRDPLFNTSHDEMWATIKGLERYGNYLNRLDYKLENPATDGIETDENGSPYQFTKPATAAIELIYALKLGGFINHGDFEIKAFVEFFAKTFNFTIKDPYGLFKQIAQRKSDRAKYLNKMVNALLAELETRDGYIP